MDESKRKEFREYLESCGVVDALTKALLKLYEEALRPDNAIAYLVKELTELNTDVKLEALHCTLQKNDACNSLLKKHLSKSILDQLKAKTSSYKSTLYDCIRSGLENHDSGVGIYAADPDCYETFQEIFDPIIKDRHLDFNTDDNVHPEPDWGSADALGDLDPDGKYIRSIRIRCGRSIEGYPFTPRMTEEQFTKLMNQLKEVLESMDGEHRGTFYALADMTAEQKRQLIDDHYLFKEDDKFLHSAGVLRYWPVGRGIFLNEAKDFMVWVNEEDHMRIISMQKGGNLCEAYGRLVKGAQFLSDRLKFANHAKFGWLSACPSNLGTSLRASVHVHLPKLAENMDQLNELAATFNLDVRGTRGEHTDAEDCVFDISNKRRLGLTEFNAVQEMRNGIVKIIAKEDELSFVTE